MAVLLGSILLGPASAGTNRIVIRVNDRIATLHDYEQAREQLVGALRRSDIPPELMQQRLADVGVEVMSDLFEEMLLLSRGDQIDAGPSREEVDQAVQRARDNSGVESDSEFAKALTTSGFTLESFRKHLEKTLTMNGVMGREIRPRIRLTEEDLRRYYQANLDDFRVPVRLNLREFVVLDTATTNAGDRDAIAAEIRGRLLGEDPVSVIEEYTDKGLTTPWIDLGWVTPGDLDAALEAAVWELGTGEFSEAIAARGGVHVAQVLEREEATVKEFGSVAEEIETQETNLRYQAEIGTYLAELERSSYVVIKPPPEAASFRSVLENRRAEGLELDERETALAGAALIAAEPDEESGDQPR